MASKENGNKDRTTRLTGSGGAPFPDAALDDTPDAAVAPASRPTIRGGTRHREDVTSEEVMRLRPHLIDLVQGRFSDSGQATTSPQDVDAIFGEHLPNALAEARKRKEPLRILFYAHGGLVSEKNALVIARDQADWWMANNVYPLFFIWETGLFETLGQILSRAWTSARPPGARDLADYTIDPIIETLSRAFGGPTIWAGMKHSAERAVDNPDGGAFYVAQKLAAFLRKDGVAAEVELHAVGHSAGSIFHSHFVPACLAAIDKPFRTLSFLAPAIRSDTFKARLTEDGGNQQRVLRSGIDRLAVFTMHKDLERGDNCAGIYRKSLLYLIHHALEAEREEPILGLEVSLGGDPALSSMFGLAGAAGDGRSEVVWSTTGDRRTGRSASQATSHGGFDNDAPTMESVLRRIRGLNDTDRIKPFPPEAQELPVRGWEEQLDLPDHMRDLVRPVTATGAAGTPPAFGAPPPAPFVWGGGATGVGGGRRRALCVGIDRYSAAPLYGCVADSQLWAQTFQRLGFDPPAMLVNERATAHAILSALRRLISDSRPGDSIVFQYSGHGTQLPDLDGDEADGDSPGQDEALCPVDYSTGAFVIDDDLGAVFDQLPAGVSLTCFIDCCHSGTISRLGVGPGLSGLDGADRRPRYIPATAAMVDAHRRFRESVRPLAARALPRGRETMREVLFAACLSTEVAYESNGQGDFTRCATAVLAQAPQGLSNEAFVQRVTQAFGGLPRQHPGLYCAPAARGLPLFAEAGGRGTGLGLGGGLGSAGGGLGDRLRQIASLIDALGG